MKKLSIIVLLLAFISCSFPSTNTLIPEQPATKQGGAFLVQSAYTLNSGYIYIYTIDSCEYLGPATINSYAGFLTHKGNCKYCLNRKKHEN